jgi:pimeloyl-[acyl-carrier protein] methyl ester esterase
MTPERLVLLPGWGLGCAPLRPLAGALATQLQVQIEPLPVLGQATVEDWLNELDRRLPTDTWLGGWSLGGMLACMLAARRREACRGLICLASHACFVAAEGWPTAMPLAVFQAFRQAYENDSALALRRFAMLCGQGSKDARGLSRHLLELADGSDSLAGLDILATLDCREALRGFCGPQLHLLAAADALVPKATAEALQHAAPRADICLLEHASHACLLLKPHAVAQRILSFMERQA